MAKKPGQFQPQGTIVIHPFGRYCNGFKSAGETDVFEARDDAKARFNVDVNRIALAGFSMGGAGAWHMGAHFADQWTCVHTGAGFVDVKRYLKLTPEKYPVSYEQTLWGVYDVPDYARNFFNVPLISYSGELDAQRDSAEYMMEVLGKEGLKVPHLIGPGMPHKYHPETIKEVQALVEKAVAKGRNPMPRKVTLQTRTLGYNKMFWVELKSMERQWEDARIDAEIGDDGVMRVKTKNVDRFELDPIKVPAGLEIDGVMVDPVWDMPHTRDWLKQKSGEWKSRASMTGKAEVIEKRRGQCGPIEEPLKRPFLVVLPEGDSGSPQITEWAKAESSHFITRWRGLMRGDPMVKKAGEVTAADMRRYTLVLWGDAKSNPLIAKVMNTEISKSLPFVWTVDKLKLGSREFDGATHVPVMIRPNPLAPRGTVIINSGLTFREAHDRTNSLQNPKLPDWAILDITTPPSAEAAGKVVAADFFDEGWRVK
jgi:hypothetical protein